MSSHTCPPCARSIHLAKERKQRKATPLSATLRFATGNLRCSRFAGSRRTRFAQTAASPDPRNAALLGAARGVVRAVAALGRRYPTGLRFARPQRKIQGLRTRTHHTRTRHGALILIPSGCAEERRRKRDKGRSCLSATKWSEFCGPPLSPSTAGCPQRSEGTQTAGSPSLWLLSLGETRESDSPAGARPGQQPKQEEQPHPTRSTSSTAKATPANRESSPRTEDSINPTGSSPEE